jgi:hypothetical protein
MSLLIVWLCGVNGIFVFFLKMQDTQYVYYHSLPSLLDPLLPKKRRLRLEDYPRDKEGLRLTLALTRRQSRKWPLVRQIQDSEPPT